MACITSTSTHPAAKHESILLDDDFVRALRERLAGLIANARKAADEYLERIADVQVTSNDIAHRDDDVHGEIKLAFDALRRLLDAREASLHHALDARTATELNELQLHAKADSDRWRVLTSTLAMAKNLVSPTLGASAASVLAQLEPAATLRLQGLLGDAPSAPVPFLTSVRFQITEAVEKAIQDAGELVIGTDDE